jgi:hypothetical protein
MKFYTLIAASLLLSLQVSFAQGLEGIIVERFYETDAADEANALDNGSVVPLPAGSVVYRVFVDMADGYKFSQIYGTAEHPLTVNATSDFYNDPSYGVTVNPATISANNIRKHTALIDSWFTTGGASNGKVGVLKIEDIDGSVGNQHGVLANNPGGCYGVPINGVDAQDGMTPNSPTTYLVPNSLGVGGALEALDQTAGNSVFIDGGAIAALGGIVGPTASNRVMIAQFTVNGDITFALNVQLVNSATGAAENYVASNPVAGELTHPTLTYNSNIAPTVAIITPVNGSTIGFGDYLLMASANDEQGYVTTVEFFVDGISVGVDSEAPFEVIYNASVGAHSITAIATDGDCLSAESQIVNVTVSSNAAPNITLEAPTSAVEGSQITLNASASDSDGTVTQVQFFVDGVLVGTDATAPYSVVWIASIGSNQVITAVASDNSGLTTTSNTVVITVSSNIPPIVAITFPFTTSDFTAPEIVPLTAEAADLDGSVVSVEFYVNGVSVGIANSAPFIVDWISQAGPAEIVAVATDSNGAQTTSVSVNLIILDPSTEPYAVGSVTQACNFDEFCIPISVSAAFPVSGVVGYDITLNYNPADLEPTGSATIFNDLIDSNFASATVNTTSAGVVEISVTLNASAPTGSQFQGYGDLICVRFNRLDGLSADDSTEVSVSELVEMYSNGSETINVNAGFQYSVANVFYEGVLTVGANGSLLNVNESTSEMLPYNYVYGAINGAVSPAAPVEIGQNGTFLHDLNNGQEVAITRDIDNTGSIQKSVNGGDVHRTKAFLNGEFVPTIWEILAMDVNLDGTVTIEDIAQMNERATLGIGEYQQAWNTGFDSSKDWVFMKESSLTDPAFAPSSTFPDDDGVGYSALRVPVLPFTLPTEAGDFNPNSLDCQEWEQENFKAVLLGDVAASYGATNVNEQDSIVFDISQAIYSTIGTTNYIEIPVILSVMGPGVQSMDVAHRFNQLKLAYVDVVGIASDLDITANFNANDNYLRVVASRNTSENLANGAVIAHLKFEVLDDCAAVFSTDFNAVSTWLNGEPAGYRFVDGATLPEPIQFASQAPYCELAPVEFTYSNLIEGSEIQSYDWQFGDGSVATGQNVSINFQSSGLTTISLSVTAANGCTYQIGAEIFISVAPVAAFTYSFDANTSTVVFDNTSSIGSGSIASYSWDFGDNSTSAETDPTHIYSSSGMFNVTLNATSAAGCVSSFTTQVDATVEIREVQASNSLVVFPNPASTRVNVITSVEGTVNVLDQTGKMLVEGWPAFPAKAVSIDTEQWAEGVYQIVFISHSGVDTFRLVKVN